MNKTVIECNGIAAGYVKGLNILQGIDMIINEKEIVSIIGPNGAGKSTLLKAIMGIINISGGRFFIDGVEKTNTPTHQIVKEGVGYVPQVENVFPSLTIEENLEIGSWSIDTNIKQSISKIFDDFPMLKERRKRQSWKFIWRTETNTRSSKSINYFSKDSFIRRTISRSFTGCN